MTFLYTVADIRAIESEAFRRRDSFSLMQQAGEAVADCVRMITADSASVVVVAGGGNNGGDAFIAAGALQQAGYRVRVLRAGDGAAATADAKRACLEWQESGDLVEVEDAFGAEEAIFQEAGCIVDGLFGIGLSRPIEGDTQTLIERMNLAHAPIVSIDTPSGLCADTGTVRGVAVCATHTVTFFGDKIGLHTNAGRDYSGLVRVETLGEAVPDSAGILLTDLPEPERLVRRADSHKGSYGTCLLIGGAVGMLGALVLAARAAAVLGAGKVRALSLTAPPPVDWLRPDVMWGDSAASLAGDVAAIGMGLGLDDIANELLAKVLDLPVPILLDADALTLIYRDTARRRQLCARQMGTVITPHPAEAARLLGVDANAINGDRLQAAKRLTDSLNVTTVLKGSGTIVYSPDGRFAVCGCGNAGLARGGSGDVLSGMIAALLAQAKDADYAARAGVYLHAKAADVLAAQGGNLGLDINLLATTAAQLAEG